MLQLKPQTSDGGDSIEETIQSFWWTSVPIPQDLKLQSKPIDVQQPLCFRNDDPAEVHWKAVYNKCKVYLGKVIECLYVQDLKLAEKYYNDFSQIDAFFKSDQYECATKLLSAYAGGDINEIKRVAQSSPILKLDSWRHIMAARLPTGDVSTLKAKESLNEEPFDEIEHA